MTNRHTKAISKTQTIIFIIILLSSITIIILVWNNSILTSKKIKIEPEIPFEKPNSQQPDPEPEIPAEKPTTPKSPIEPEELSEPEQLTEPEPTQKLPTQPPNEDSEVPTEEPTTPNTIPTEPKRTPSLPEPANTEPTQLQQASVTVGDETYTFSPTKVKTIRPDIFNDGFFSMFDVLVHLDKQNLINLEYHFDNSLNAHIIESINGEPNWWYQTYYSGGWSERNVFRPDHYPWKDGTTLIFYKESPARLESIYSEWKEEVERRENNNGKIIIPQVIIIGQSHSERALIFENVEVKPHNLRNDVFKENITTAIDVILSLGDQGKITYGLQWYESIGTADIVRSYWVNRINEDKAYGRSGFVYEAGSQKFQFSSGNHIHLASDVRILNSPEYVKYFWISI